MMDIVTWLSRHLFVPLYNRRFGVRNDALKRQLMKSQYYSQDRLLEQQWRDVRSLLTYTYEHNPWYRKRFQSVGARPEDIKDAGHVASLPLLTKDDIRSEGESMFTEGFSKDNMIYKRTGGSTGVPVRVYWDRAATNFKNAVTFRHDGWAGYRPGDRRAALWGDTARQFSFKERLYKLLCERTLYLDTLNMDEEKISSFLRNVRSFRPRTLIGHAHSLYFLAAYIQEQDRDGIHFDGIISTAETLIPSERQTIEDVFGNVVFNRYGCEEVSLIASECEHRQGLHIPIEGLYVEVLDGDESKPGRLVVTDLVNRGFPLIRYDIGDMATTQSGSCPCGRGLPRLGRICGRTSEMLYTTKGKPISGISILDTFMIHIPGLKQVQIIQEELNHVLLNIVRGADFCESSISALEQVISDVFGPGMTYQITYVDTIPTTPRGKYQFTICRVNKTDANQL